MLNLTKTIKITKNLKLQKLKKMIKLEEQARAIKEILSNDEIDKTMETVLSGNFNDAFDLA